LIPKEKREKMKKKYQKFLWGLKLLGGGGDKGRGKLDPMAGLHHQSET